MQTKLQNQLTMLLEFVIQFSQKFFTLQNFLFGATIQNGRTLELSMV